MHFLYGSNRPTSQRGICCNDKKVENKRFEENDQVVKGLYLTNIYFVLILARNCARVGEDSGSISVGVFVDQLNSLEITEQNNNNGELWFLKKCKHPLSTLKRSP